MAPLHLTPLLMRVDPVILLYMYGQYLSVIRILRAPMRRWWIKAGSWWLGAYIVCRLYDLYYTWVLLIFVVMNFFALRNPAPIEKRPVAQHP